MGQIHEHLEQVIQLPLVRLIDDEADAHRCEEVLVDRLGHRKRIARDYAALVNARAIALSALACAALVVGGKYFFDLSWESALVLAPVFVLCLGAIAFLVVLWAKVIKDSLRS